MKIKIRRANPDIELPKYNPVTAAAFDLASAVDITIQPKQIDDIPTGLYIDVPEGYFLAIISRSSTPARVGLMMPHSVGVVDPLYSGPNDEIRLRFFNFTDRVVSIKKGERLAQGLLLESPKIEWEEVDSLSSESRGGFGSTNL